MFAKAQNIAENFSLHGGVADISGMEIGAVLRQIRSEAGLTQAKLAERAGITRVYLNMLEHNLKCPTLDVFCRVCLTAGVRPSEAMANIEKVNSLLPDKPSH